MSLENNNEPTTILHETNWTPLIIIIRKHSKSITELKERNEVEHLKRSTPYKILQMCSGTYRCKYTLKALKN